MKTYSENANSRDIARLAGVSQATVSRVLSGGANVSEKTREKVMRVVHELGYQPNPFAQAMRTRQSGSIGVAVSRITNPIVPEILEALSASITAAGRRMVVWNTDMGGSNALISTVRQGAVDGIIFTAASHQGDAMRAVLDNDVPVVSFNRYLVDANCDQIVSANLDGGRILAGYLADAGRRKIAFLNGPTDRTTLADRELGFRQGLADAMLELPDDRYAQSEFSNESFRRIAMDWMRGPNPPDAIACGNDVIAMNVLNGLKAVGASAPDDVWVTGFDGIEMAGWDVFDLTTMRQPIDLMATDAVEALISRIGGQFSKPKLIQYRTEFIARGSTANMPLREN